ncbi:hypothetical protein [Sinomicrobium pectinilyticum]|uniref:Lipoprotein n=1 Tax=Sinomicrobium pectinilyticum TaxID=1084421 RepID=A0A3N0D030_SINP1|nr:hypothetical protein [Sinomicrobium pectinilyticum]RNL68613.1 hypothetical protein ED312_23125 [Sinomicrobium pectinilyticum]
MNKKKLIKVIILISFFFSCSNRQETKVTRYDKNIVSIFKNERKKEKNVLNITHELPEYLNLYFLDNKIETAKLTFLSPPSNIDNYIYGKKSVFKYDLVLYSNEYPQLKGNNEMTHDEVIGWLLLLKNNEIISWIKVFEGRISNPEILESYLFDNYIITIHIYDEGYDLMIEGGENQAEYSFAVTEVMKDGRLQLLEEEKGRIIARKYLSDNKQFKNIGW